MSDPTKPINKLLNDPMSRARVMKAADKLLRAAKKEVDREKTTSETLLEAALVAEKQKMAILSATGCVPKGSITSEQIAEDKGAVAKGMIEDQIRAAGLEPSGDPDVDYFTRNMLNALRVRPSHVLHVGANDFLVVRVDVRHAPASDVERYLRRVKHATKSFFDRRGLQDRVLWIASVDNTGTSLSVISVEEAGQHHDYRRRRDIPVMG